MSAAWMIARVELRRRWPALLALTVLVAVAGGVVLAALVGAHRTSTTVDRFRTWAKASDVSYQTSDPAQADPMLAAARDRGEVEIAAARRLVNAFPVDQAIPDIAVMSDPEGVYGFALDRPRLLDGRLPAPDAPDEILLNELAARVTGLGVGDRVRVRTWSTGDLEALFSDPNFPGFNGPEVELSVVGVGRTPEELPGDVRRATPYALGSPAFLSAHPDIGAWPPSIIVRLRNGDGLAALDAAMREQQGVDVAPSDDPHYVAGTTARDVYLDTSEQTVNSLATGLLLLALGAAVAGALATGQAVSRQLAGAASSARVLGSLGLTRSERALALSLPIVGAGLVGAGLACALATALSPVVLLGLARRAEIDPGVWVEPAILAAGGAVIVAALAAWSYRAARRSQSRLPAVSDRSPSALVRVANRTNAPPSVTVGVRLASDRGRGSGAVPVRSAFIGLAIGVAGVVAAGVISVSLHDLIRNPSHFGWNWSTMPDYFGDADISEAQDRLVADDRVEAIGSYTVGSVMLDDRSVSGFSMTVFKGDVSFTVLDGRMPSGPGEVALGRQTMADLGVSPGDALDATGTDGSSSRLVVVGTVVPPPTENFALDVGAVLTPDELAALEHDEPVSSLVLRYPAESDPTELEQALSDDYGLQFNIFTQPQTPGSIRNFSQGRDIALALAAFFAALAAVGLFHALLVSTRRRLPDLAMLRALGFRRRQVRAAVLVQALVLCGAGTLVGIPAGLIAGRLVWHILVGGLGIVADPQTPWLLILVAVPSTALAGAVLAWWPGRAAVRGRPADQLGAER